jgi:PAS domain S-box-containing protein
MLICRPKISRAMTICLVLVCLIFGTCGLSLAQTDLASKRILILHSFGYAQPAYKIIDASLQDAFIASGLDFNNLYFEFMDLARDPGPEYRRNLIDVYRQKFKERKIDLVVALHTEALDFLVGDARDVFPGVPVISVLGPPRFQHSDLNRSVIILPFSIDVVATAKAIMALKPDTRKLIIIAGSSALDRRFENRVKTELQAWPAKPEVESISDLPLSGILSRVANLPPGTALLYTTVYADSTGKTFMPPDILRMISATANAPVFGLFETLLGDNGIVGGIILDHRVEGQRAVRIAMDILKGNLPAESVRILAAPLTPMFDWPQLKRWGFDESALPAGSIVLNRPVSVWDRYKVVILGTLIFILLESALIIILFLQGRRKRRAEQALRESEERLDLATSAAGTGIWIMNMDTGAVWVTDKLRELFRFDPDEKLSFERFLEVIHPEDREHVRKSVMQSLEKRDYLGVEYRIVHPDGSIRWIVASGHPYAAAPGQPKRLMGVSIDVTQRKTTELQLSESRTLLSALVDSTSDMIWSVDSERFGLLTFNRSLADYFLRQRGIRIEVGMDPGVLLPTEEYAEKWRMFYRRALEEGSFTTEYPVYAETRTLRLNLNKLQRDDVVFGVSVFGQDITERKKAEESLRESEAKYRSLYDSMMDGYVLVDMDGRILKCNEAYRAMTGYTQDELLRLTYRDITPEKWHVAEREIIEQQVLTRGYSDVYEKEYRRMDGTVLPIELRIFLSKDDTGSNVGMWAIVRDISGRKLIESEARKLREDLAHVTRVSTLGELTSSLAHEINQPLAAILSNAQAAQRFLSQDKPDMKEVGEILGDIIRDDNRAAEVIRKIRSLLKKEEARYESLSLNDVVEEILNVIRNDTALAAVSIEKEFDTKMPAVWGDRIQLQQVILNLVLNAAESMREEGPGSRTLIIGTSKKDGRFAEVSIKDAGPGIDQKAIGRIFEPFYTTKSGGMGMGLAISKDIVKSHRGDLRAVNNPDRGATFSFTVLFDSGVRI